MEDYCEAIKEAKLTSKPGPRSTRFYDKALFREFVNKNIDIRDLNQHMADFTQGAEVAQALHTIRGRLQSGIRHKLGYGGSLFQIGSFYDGSKTGRLNEMDCLFVISESDVVVQQISSNGDHFRVYIKGTEVKPRDINQKLIAAMYETLSEITLPDGWTQGGYASQEFSGVRCSGPAVTALFCSKDENHISLDVSIAFPLTDSLQKGQGFPGHLRDHCQSLALIVSDIQHEVARTAIAPADLHLIGNMVDNTWQPTTALAEAEILRILDTYCSVKGTLDICKALSSKQQKWYESNNIHSEKLAGDENAAFPARRQQISTETKRGLTLENLNIYMETDSDDKEKRRDKLNVDMAFQHIWLSSIDRQHFKEVLKSDASINTAAIKHIVLKTALQMKGAFSRDNKTYKDSLVRAVFEELSDSGSLYTAHAFLRGIQLPKFSLSVNLSHVKDDVVGDLQEQCQLILDQGLKKSKCQVMPIIKRDRNSYLGDYCYRIAVTLSTNCCCSVDDAEQIAVAMSAMMNTSGGVLQLQIDMDILGSDSCCEPMLKEFGIELLRIITTQEKWISKRLFSSYVKQRVQEQSREILYFVTKAKDLVTHSSYAYILDSGEVKLITEHDVACSKLRECYCKGEDKCQHHEDSQPELPSALSDTDKLIVNTCLPDTVKTHYFCRHYQLYGRPLLEILCTQSVSSDIKELVSALANTDGGSIFLGVTHTDPPVVKGYSLDGVGVPQLNECFSQVINGQDGTTVFSTVKSVHKNWKLFFHPVSVSGSDADRDVIEICVRQCPGGMFCFMPFCFEVSPSGDILPLKHFQEWKDKMLLTYKPESDKVSERFEDHFGGVSVPENDSLQDVGVLGVLEGQTPTRSETTIDGKDSQTSEVFQWWLSINEDITSESLSFDHCCARELADDAINIHKPFTFFPSVQAVMEQYENSTDICSALAEIQQKYRNDNGAGVIIQNMPDDITTELNGILPRHHVCDVVVLTANSRPSVITVLNNDCDKAAAAQYNGTLTCLLKRICLLTYRHWCDSSTHLSFQRQLYYIGSGFELEDKNAYYPEEYLRPTPGTLNIVQCTLAAILLHCEPMTDRFGDVMVRHLSSLQAKILLDKRSKVTVIEGKAGSGKSILALEAMRRIKQHEKDESSILFICRGRGLAAFVKYQAELMDICIDIQTVQVEKMDQVKGDFSQYTHVFLDDAHAIPLTGEPNCQGMYRSLFSSLSKQGSHCYILLDPDMQDYRGCIPSNFSKEIQRMAREYHFIRRQDVKTEILGKILRNSARMCQFIGANLGDEIEELKNIRNLPEDGAYLYIIEDLAKTKKSVHHHGGGKRLRFQRACDYRMHVVPFSCRDMTNALQCKMYDKGDLDAAGVKTLKKIKQLFRAALKGSVYEEHGEEDSSNEEDEEDGDGDEENKPDEEEKDDNVKPFSCRDIANVLQHKMDHKGDLNAAVVKKVKTLKLLLLAALKGSVYEEHGEKDCSDEEEEQSESEEDDVNPNDDGKDEGGFLGAAMNTLKGLGLPLPAELRGIVQEHGAKEGSNDDDDDESDHDARTMFKKLMMLAALKSLRDAMTGSMNTEHREDNRDDDGGDESDHDERTMFKGFMMLAALKSLRDAMRGSVNKEHGEDSSDDDGGAETDHKTGPVTLVSRLRDVLRGTLYQERHVTILTENINEKILVKDLIACARYHTQEATDFPVRHVVVDTLDNFEGLDSPVILFIVPESWGTGYVGSLKYSLCIATRAISRLEFLVPWDPMGREQDLAELRRVFRTEPPVDYDSLQVTRIHWVQAGYRTLGMCYFSGRLYTTEVQEKTKSVVFRLAVYSVTGLDTVTLLDTLDLKGQPTEPRICHQSDRVYLSCKSIGVYVVKYDGSQLVHIATLRHVGEPSGLAVVSPDTLYMCDKTSKTVCLVNVTQDRVTTKLENPVKVGYSRPFNIAVLGDMVLVGYGSDELAIYRHGVPTPCKLPPKPQGLKDITSLSTDHHSRFLLVDRISDTLYVLDISGNVTHTISIPGDRKPHDCTVVGGQTWVGCGNGDIIVMSPQ